MQPQPRKSDLGVKEWISAGSQLYKVNNNWRMALEAGLMGFALMIALAVFSPSGQSNNYSQSSYNPAQRAAQTVTQPQQAAHPSGSSQQTPSLSHADLDALRAATGGNVQVLGNVEPIVVKPVMSLDEVQKSETSQEASVKPPEKEFGRVSNSQRRSKGIKPAYQ